MKVGTESFHSCSRSGREVVGKSIFERQKRVEYYELEGQCEQNHEDVCRKVGKPRTGEESV